MSKYHAVPTVIDGIRFDSKAEAARYRDLRILEAAGEIYNLQVHVQYPLVVNGIKIGSYEADFVYGENGRIVVEDVKGVKTPVYRLKNKLMKAIHGIEIVET
jgi:hypothetical protein